MHKIISKYQWVPSPDQFEQTVGPSETVKDDALSIREIFERYANGQHLSLHEYIDSAPENDEGLVADPSLDYLDMASRAIDLEEEKSSRSIKPPKQPEKPEDEPEVPPES